MGFSRWFCSNNTKNMFVKIVHPGGHVELHDRPITASDVISRNPKCCLAYPNVFKQPWAIVEPETILIPGQKFYVVPLTTVRKLQLHAIRYSRVQNVQDNGHSHENGEYKPSHKSYPKQFRGFIGERTKWCTCFRKGMKIKTRNDDDDNDRSKETTFGSSGQNLLKKMDFLGENSPKRLSGFDQWQPSLKSISEEYE